MDVTAMTTRSEQVPARAAEEVAAILEIDPAEVTVTVVEEPSVRIRVTGWFESAVLPRSFVDRDHPSGLSELGRAQINSGTTDVGLAELHDLRFGPAGD